MWMTYFRVCHSGDDDAAMEISRPVRTADALDAGLTPKRLRGKSWVSAMHGVVRPADLALDPIAQRVADAYALVGPHHLIGGWASLWLHGNQWFDGLDRDVLIHCLSGAQLRRRHGIRPSQGLVVDEECESFDGYRVTTMARAAVDEMRTAHSVREAVVVCDMATSTTTGMAHTTGERIKRVLSMHRKSRGILQADRAVAIANSRSASPFESRLRLVAQFDADLPNLQVNAAVFDRAGRLLGVADLLDTESGLVIEADGAGHREETQHAADNAREESFERAGLVVCRISPIDMKDRAVVVTRIVAARRHAANSSGGGWTTTAPEWWSTWPPARRWD